MHWAQKLLFYVVAFAIGNVWFMACDGDYSTNPVERAHPLNLSADPSVGACDIIYDGGTTWVLQADCTTPVSVVVPDTYTLDTNTYKIEGTGNFEGAVVRNAGATMHVTGGGTISASASGCFGGDSRLRGILFEGAGGSVTNVTVENIHRGPNGCQEGNGIEVRNEPFDGTGSNPPVVNVSNVTVSDYQKTGIVGNGNVVLNVSDAVVTGLGQVNFIAQNGVQFGFGATGTLTRSTVSGNWYTGCTNNAKKGGCSTVSAGVLLFDVVSSNVKISKVKYSGNQMNVLNVNSSSLGN